MKNFKYIAVWIRYNKKIDYRIGCASSFAQHRNILTNQKIN